MSKRVAAVLGALVVFGSAMAAQQGGSSTPSIVGVWRIAEVTFTGPNARKITNPQPGLRIFTRRHYSFTAVTSDKPRAELPPPGKATDKQLADAFGPFQANAGTYEVKGNEITTRPTVAKAPNVMSGGNFATRTLKFEGNETVWITDKVSQDGPVANPTTFKMTRVE